MPAAWQRLPVRAASLCVRHNSAPPPPPPPPLLLQVIVALKLEAKLLHSIEEAVECLHMLGTLKDTGRIFARQVGPV